MYEKELNNLKKSNRFRTRNIYNEAIYDLASNDYLGLSQNKDLFMKASNDILNNKFNSPRASLLVNGYNSIHKNFEDNLKKNNNFEDAICLGSGFLANISLIEALCRKNDIIFIDEEYHASGILATRLLDSKQVIIFKHNDYEDLEKKLIANKKSGRTIIAIEGIYSMNGDIAKLEIFHIADKYNSLLIVDEAHSSGVLGKNLLGIYDFYNLEIKSNYIKMGTLGKAYGSYGAYILGSKKIIDFLTNRAKPIIYSTAPSLFDIALAKHSLNYICINKDKIKIRIKENLQIIKEELNIDSKSLIIPIEIGNNKKVMEIQKTLLNENILIGAIRQPTVKKAIIRLIAKIDIEKDILKKICKILKKSL